MPTLLNVQNETVTVLTAAQLSFHSLCSKCTKTANSEPNAFAPCEPLCTLSHPRAQCESLDVSDEVLSSPR